MVVTVQIKQLSAFSWCRPIEQQPSTVDDNALVRFGGSCSAQAQLIAVITQSSAVK